MTLDADVEEPNYMWSEFLLMPICADAQLALLITGLARFLRLDVYIVYLGWHQTIVTLNAIVSLPQIL